MSNTKTEIQQIFRAVIEADCIFQEGRPSSWNDGTMERMSDLEEKVEAIAKKYSVEYESQNTQALSQGSFLIEHANKQVVEQAVAEIEALIEETDGVELTI